MVMSPIVLPLFLMILLIAGWLEFLLWLYFACEEFVDVY